MTEIIKTNCGDENFRLVCKIRDSVFVDEQGIDPDEEFDEYDTDTSTDYYLLFDDGKPVATVRAAYMPEGVKISRIAVLGECRGRHYGAKVVCAALGDLFSQGIKTVYLNSQLHAVGFYEKLGFEVCGDELVDRGKLNLPMIITPETFKGE